MDKEQFMLLEELKHYERCLKSWDGYFETIAKYDPLANTDPYMEQCYQDTLKMRDAVEKKLFG